MALASDALIKKAITTTTTLSALIPHIWAARIERNLRVKAALQQSVVVNTDLLVPNSGDKISIPVLPDFGGFTTGGTTLPGALTEGTDMTDISLDAAFLIDFVPSEYGMSVGVTRKTLDRIKYDGVEAIVDKLSYAMGRLFETQIAALWNAVAVTAAPSTTSPIEQLYPNAHTSTTVVSADVMSDDLILQGWQQMEERNNVPFEDGYYVLFIAPKQYRNLMRDTDVRQDLRFGAPDKLFKGEVGVLHNCRIVVTNSIVTVTENTIPVYKCLMVAPRWAAIAYKRRPELVVDPTLYDFGRRRRFGVLADFQIGLLHPERAEVLSVA